MSVIPKNWCQTETGGICLLDSSPVAWFILHHFHIWSGLEPGDSKCKLVCKLYQWCERRHLVFISGRWETSRDCWLLLCTSIRCRSQGFCFERACSHSQELKMCVCVCVFSYWDSNFAFSDQTKPQPENAVCLQRRTHTHTHKRKNSLFFLHVT